MAKQAKSESKKPPNRLAPSFLSVAVVVSDRGRAVRWYTEALGLEHVDDMAHWQTVGRKGGRGLLHLCQVSEFDAKAPMEPGNTGIALTVPGEFLTSCAELERRGVVFSAPPKKEAWGWGATIRDPDGNEIYLTPES